MQAINLYGERPYLQPELQEARDFVQATEHSKQLTNAFRADIQKYWDELESVFVALPMHIPMRPCTHGWQTGSAALSPELASNAEPSKTVYLMIKVIACLRAVSRVRLPWLQELACVDLSMEIAERALEVVRGSIELAAARRGTRLLPASCPSLSLRMPARRSAYRPCSACRGF